MLRIFNKYSMTALSFTLFIRSIIVDYSKYEDNFTWLGTVQYKIYLSFGALPINASFLLLTIIFYNSEKNETKDKKTKYSWWRTFTYLLVISIILYDTIRYM